MFCHRFSNLYWAHLRKCLGVWEKAGRTRNYPYSTLVPTHPTFFPTRIYPVGNPWFSHNDPYFLMDFVRSKSVTHLIWFWKIWVAFSNPTLTAKKATSTQIQQSCGKGAHPKGRTVCEYIKKGKTRFVPENLGYFWNPGNFQLGLGGLGTQLLLIYWECVERCIVGFATCWILQRVFEGCEWGGAKSGCGIVEWFSGEP